MGWRLARSLQTLSSEVRARWPGTTIWTVGDQSHASRPSDHNPHPDNGVVSAIDVKGATQARTLRDHLQATKDPRVEYWIFDGRKGGSDHGWQIKPYSGSNQHTDHIHVSVGRGTDGVPTRPDLYDDPSPWGLTSTSEEDVMELVAQIQRTLIRAGYDLGDFAPYGDGYPKGADGQWGSKTEDALLDALKKSGGGTHVHNVTGQVGIAGRTGLGTELSKHLKATGRIKTDPAG